MKWLFRCPSSSGATVALRDWTKTSQEAPFGLTGRKKTIDIVMRRYEMRTHTPIRLRLNIPEVGNSAGRVIHEAR
jgi:hypothetical protein